MSKFPHECTPQGQLTVSPSIPCDGPVYTVPVPSSLWLLIAGVAILARYKRSKGVKP